MGFEPATTHNKTSIFFADYGSVFDPTSQAAAAAAAAAANHPHLDPYPDFGLGSR